MVCNQIWPDIVLYMCALQYTATDEHIAENRKQVGAELYPEQAGLLAKDGKGRG